MPFHFEPLEILQVMLIKPEVFSDARGYFMEAYKYSDFAAAGITEHFVQDNRSRSTRGVLRGLHYQRHPRAQGKLVWVVAGEVFDVAADIRPDSPTFGRWVSVYLSAENKHMLYVPPGCAHGFCVVSDAAEVAYKATQEYAPEYEAGIIWNDPALKIRWPVAEPILSPRDATWPRLAEAELLPTGLDR